MPIQLTEENDGMIAVVHVSGKLTRADYAPFEKAFDRLVLSQGKLRVLFDMSDFHGWDVGAAWEDLKLGTKHYSDIERLAMVGENKWQQGMATFCKPFTKAKVRYFDRSEAAAAQTWLREA